MSSHRSGPDLLVLHAVRTLGHPDTARVAARTQLSVRDADRRLSSAQALGYVQWSSFGDEGGWFMTDAGKIHGERLLATELDQAGARGAVAAVHHDFLPANSLVAETCTHWQLVDLGIGDEPVTLGATVDALRGAADTLQALEARLAAWLERFRGYHARFSAACDRASDDPAWITGTDRDSAHKVWFELHEDLIATLGLER